MSISRNLEIRHLPVPEILNVCQILDKNKSWEKLMEQIPKDLNVIHQEASDLGGVKRKYSTENIHIIKIESESQKRSPTKMLLDEWGTSGQKRATVGDLLQLLIKVELFRAADFVAVRILNEPPPKRPETGPAAHVDITLPYYTHDHKQTESILDALTYPRSSNLTLANEDDVQNNNKDHPVESGGDRIKLSKTRLSIQPDELSDLILFSNQNMLGDNNNMLPTKAELSESIALDTLDTESDFNCIDTDSIIISDMDIGDIPDLSAVLNARKSHTTTIDDCLPDISKLNLDLSVEKDYDNSSQLNNIPDITMLQNL